MSDGPVLSMSQMIVVIHPLAPNRLTLVQIYIYIYTYIYITSVYRIVYLFFTANRKLHPSITLRPEAQSSSSKGSGSSPSGASLPRCFTILKKWPNTAQTLRRRFIRRACSTTLLHLSTARTSRCLEGQRPMMCYRLLQAERSTNATHGRGSLEPKWLRMLYICIYIYVFFF